MYVFKKPPIKWKRSSKSNLLFVIFKIEPEEGISSIKPLLKSRYPLKAKVWETYSEIKSAVFFIINTSICKLFWLQRVPWLFLSFTHVLTIFLSLSLSLSIYIYIYIYISNRSLRSSFLARLLDFIQCWQRDGSGKSCSANIGVTS